MRNLAGYAQFEFLTETMPDALAAADFVLSRAGSNTLSELLALRKPMLLVPYPLSASRGDQIKNAESFVKQGFAHILPQEDMVGGNADPRAGGTDLRPGSSWFPRWKRAPWKTEPKRFSA